MKNNFIYSKLIFSYFIWSFIGLIINKVKINSFQAIFLISIFSLFWYILFLTLRKDLSSLKKIKFNFNLLIFILICGSAVVIWLKSFTLIPVAQVLFLFSSVPIFALFLEIGVFKHKIKTAQVLPILIGILGIGVLLSNDLSKNTAFISLASILVLFSSFLFAVQGFFIKKYNNIYNPYIICFIFMISQALVSAPFLFTEKISFEIYSVLFLFIYSFFHALAFYFYMGSFKSLKVSTVRLIGYIEVVIGSFLGIAFLSQPLTLLAGLGGVLILSSSYLISKVKE